MNTSIIIDFVSPCDSYSLTFDDNGKVAYAYLKHNHQIVGDVWLYNRITSPNEPDWDDKKNIPFANPEKYVAEGGILTSGIYIDDVVVYWKIEGGTPVAYIYVYGDLYGVLGVNDKPGYARYAAKDGPLAHVLEL